MSLKKPSTTIRATHRLLDLGPPQEHGKGPGATPSWETDLPSPSSYQLPIAPQLAVGLRVPCWGFRKSSLLNNTHFIEHLIVHPDQLDRIELCSEPNLWACLTKEVSRFSSRKLWVAASHDEQKGEEVSTSIRLCLQGDCGYHVTTLPRHHSCSLTHHHGFPTVMDCTRREPESTLPEVDSVGCFVLAMS